MEESFRQGLEAVKSAAPTTGRWRVALTIFHADGNNINHISLNGADSLEPVSGGGGGPPFGGPAGRLGLKRVKGAADSAVACGGR